MSAEAQGNEQSSGRMSALMDQLRATPGAVSGATGLALCLCTLEAYRFPVVQQVSLESSSLSNLIAFAMLAALALYYRFGRTKILRRPAAIIAFSAAGTLCLYAYYAFAGAGGSAFSPAWIALHSFTAFGMILTAAWMENLYEKRPSAAASIFIAALPLVFCFQALVALLTPSVAKGTCALFPLMSAVLLVMFRKSEPFSLALAGRREAKADGAGYDARAMLVPFALVALAMLCYGIFFTKMHTGWLPSQNSWGAATIQLSSASGALVAGLVLAAVAPMPGKRNGVFVCECLILAFAFFSIYLSTYDSNHFTTLYLVPLNTAQKIVLYLLFYVCLALSRTRAKMIAFCLLFAIYKAGFALFNAVSTAAEPAYGSLVGDLMFIAALAVAIGLLVAIMAAPSLVPLQPGVRPGADPDDEGEGSAVPYKEIAFYFLFGQKYNLTQREIEVLPFLADMRNAKSIADELCVTQATAKTHMRNIYAKLDVHTQKDLVDLVDRERQSLLEQLPSWYVRR